MRFCGAQSYLVWCLLAAVVLVAASAVASAQARVEFDELPQHVQAAVRDRFPDAEILEATHFNEDGIVGFEVMIEQDDRVLGVILARSGEIAGVWRPDDRPEENDVEESEDDEREQEHRWQGRPAAFTPTYVRRASRDLGLGVERIVFVKRHTYVSSHFYTDFIDGCHRYGGNLCVLSLETGRVRELVPELEEGIFGRYDLSFDARRIVFDWKSCDEEGFLIYEVGVDGRRLRQLTFPPEDEAERIAKYDNSFLVGETTRRYNHHTDDMHPCYLPDGGICFTSTRCEYGTLCDAPDILTTTVLYRMDADGRNMEKLTNSAVSEFSPSIMDDGRILYTFASTRRGTSVPPRR